MSDRIEESQPFRFIFTCYKNGVIIDLSTTSARTIEYRDLEGNETIVTATILNAPGTDGKIYYDFPLNAINQSITYRIKAWLTFATGKIPSDPVDLKIYDEWESVE